VPTDFDEFFAVVGCESSKND